MNRVTILILIFVSLTIISCNKDNNLLYGRITINNNGNIFELPLSTVSIYQNKKDKTKDVADFSVKTNQDGTYSIDRIPRGNYNIDITYSDSLGKIDTLIPQSFNKKDKKRLDIQLKY